MERTKAIHFSALEKPGITFVTSTEDARRTKALKRLAASQQYPFLCLDEDTQRSLRSFLRAIGSVLDVPDSPPTETHDHYEWLLTGIRHLGPNPSIVLDGITRASKDIRGGLHWCAKRMRVVVGVHPDVRERLLRDEYMVHGNDSRQTGPFVIRSLRSLAIPFAPRLSTLPVVAQMAGRRPPAALPAAHSPHTGQTGRCTTSGTD